MGLLNDTWLQVDRMLERADAPLEHRDSMQSAYFLGAKIVLNAITEACRMEHDEGLAFLGECRADCSAYQLRVLDSLVGMLAKAH
jgi:hypothetical protein